MYISSRQVSSEIYFSAHHPGSVDLVLSEEVRRGEGPITLSAAAAEDLLVNLQVNAEMARRMAEVTVKRPSVGPSRI